MNIISILQEKFKDHLSEESLNVIAQAFNESVQSAVIEQTGSMNELIEQRAQLERR